MLDVEPYNYPSRYTNVGCLYCGKDIGPIRLLRDREFCSPVHRQNYHNRLGRVLGQLSEPDDAPARMADFQLVFPIQEGNRNSLCASAKFGYIASDPLIGSAWTLSLPAAPGNSFRPAHALPGISEPPQADTAFSPAVALQLQNPRFDLTATEETADVEESTEVVTPAICDRWLPAGAAEAAERMAVASFASASAFAARHVDPSMHAVALAGRYIRIVDQFAETPAPEPVATFVAPVLDSRPALRVAPPAQLRFSLHAVEDVGPPAAKAPPEPVGRPAPAMAVPEAMPVESMPRVPAPAVAATATIPSMRLPSLMPLTRPLTLAGTAAPPPAVAVESMPRVRIAEPRPATVRVALRKPALAHFQMAEEASNALASPVLSAPPMAVESMPSAQPFVARPAIAPLALMAKPLEAQLLAVVPPGIFLDTAQPTVAEPAARGRCEALLEPIARVAAQPAGTQPERPKPAIPHPPMFALDYYCQRITNSPKIQLEWREGNIALLQHPFEMRPALRPFAEYAGKSRKLLPFEEIFAQEPKDGEPPRVKLSVLGKIAATIMVGVALWGGSRLAGVGDHAASIEARVASSERTLTAQAEVRRSQMSSKTGDKGTMSKIRHAIAERAAMEVTDTFTSGMEAWGSGAKSWVPGWQRSPAGYMRTGEMALFQPSLNYTDYHMEFYGQIEEKSMGWVVRAQDKKNYYAMKFKVIEPGLRPIIAIVHYQVTNGKRGHVEETPLNVMVHNNEPYHVSVDVRGNRFMAAIEGEPVESWTDDAPRKGGVGFFSDTGERARLYWMKISRNQDWLGRFCAYLSGDSGSGQQVAEIWGLGPMSPGDSTAPPPADPRHTDLALALAGARAGFGNSPRRAKTSKKRRSEGWIS